MVLLVIAEIKCHNEERMNAYLEFLKPLLIPATGSASTGCTHRLTTGFDGHIDETVSVEVETNTVHLAAHWESQKKWDNYLAFRQASGVVDNTVEIYDWAGDPITERLNMKSVFYIFIRDTLETMN